MVEWIKSLVPGTREVGDVAMFRGKAFAAVAAWRRHPWNKLKYILLFEANREQPIVCDTMAFAKRYVEAAAASVRD